MADPRSAADRAQAEQVDRRQKALAARLEADRQAREASVPAARPAVRMASPAVAASAPRHRWHRRAAAWLDAADAAEAASRPFRATVPRELR